MLNIILAVALSVTCPITNIINDTGSWTKEDEKTLQFTKTRCVSNFGKRSPCLKAFIKKEELVYRAICGPQT